MFQARQQLLKDFAGVADQCGIDLHVLVDFGAIDFDVNLAGFLGVRAQIAGDAIVEAHAHGDEQVGFLDGVIDPRLSVHAHHAEIQRIAGREAANAEQGHGDGKIAGVHKAVEHAHGAGNHDAVAGENQRALGGVEQIDGALKFRLVVIDALALGRKLRHGSFPIEIAGSLLRVFGDIDEDRARAARVGDQEGFAHGAGDVLGARDDNIVLGDRHSDAGDVDFLEGIGAEQLAADLAGDANDRRRVEHGGGNAGDHVGGAGTGGGHGNADSPAGARVAIGHVRSALLMAHQNVVQLGFAERVVYREDCSAGIAKDVANAELGQRFAKNFRTSELHDVLETVCAAVEKLLGTRVTAPSDEEETSNAYLAITPLV